jgi:hypothetical protein
MKQTLLRRTAMRAPDVVGSRPALLAAIALTCAWVVWGVFARWSTTSLLWPSAIASVVTFLLFFSLQYTQNRDTRVVHGREHRDRSSSLPGQAAVQLDGALHRFDHEPVVVAAEGRACVRRLLALATAGRRPSPIGSRVARWRRSS